MRTAALPLVLCCACATPRATTAPSSPVKPSPPISTTAAAYPATRAEAVTETLFDTVVRDPYRWLESEKSPEVRAWMKAEDEVARDRLHSLDGRDALVRRLRELYYVESVTPPSHLGGRYFYSRTHVDKEKAVVYWREGEGPEHTLLDPNTMSSDGTTSLGVVRPSWDGKSVAYSLRRNNSDEATLHVMEVESGKVSAIDVIPGAKYAVPSWTPAGDGFYYTWLPVDPAIPVAERPGYSEVRFHRLGTDPARDTVIHERTGSPQLLLGGELSRDGRWLFAYVQHGWRATDVYYRQLGATGAAHGTAGAWRPLVVGKDAHYEVTAWKDRLYVVTDEGAPRGRVLVAEPGRLERAAWREIVPEAADAVLDGAQVVGGHLVLAYLKNATSALEVRTLDGKPVRTIALPGIGTTRELHGNPDEDTAYFAFTSFTVPVQILRTSIKSGETSVWAAAKVPIDPTPYTVDQVWYPSRDGTRISMFVVHRRDLKRDGSTPFLIGGYGGFGVSMTPAFSGGLYPWLEAGGGYALPNLRGGGEYGESWHRAGMLDHKQNVFDDFIAAAEYLAREGYTRPERLAIRGGSNGGLLVGAALTQRPELYRAVVCAVPLLDMVRYHRFGSAKTWIPEYGSAEDEAGFRTLYAYSPYHHVRAGTAYPALLMLSADSDDRVDPMHARKMVAALQAAQAAPDRPVLLRIEQHAGHGGADLVKQAVEQSADAYAFLFHELGMYAAPAQR